MKKATITLSYHEEKLTALRLYLGEKGLQVEDELSKALDALYGKIVPQSVRYYLDLREEETNVSPPKRAKPQTPAPAQEEKQETRETVEYHRESHEAPKF